MAETTKKTTTTTSSKTVETPKTVPESTPKTRTIADVNPSDRVPIDNLCDWDIHFRSLESNRDLFIAGGVKNYRQLTVAEIDSQVKIGNEAFCGTDGYGTHAPIRIIDPVIREYVFGADTNPKQLTEDNVRELLRIFDKRKFKDSLENLVVTNAEKRMIVLVAERVGIEDVESFKIAAIEKMSGIDFDHDDL